MKKISPYLIIILSFFTLILIGSLLLYLPISKIDRKGLSFIDAFFVSTSAVTITGLSPIANLSATLTIFGKIVLAILIQIGGLSIVTFSVFIMYLIGANIGISNRVLIKESFNENYLDGKVKLVIKIVIYTFILEFISFLVNLFIFMGEFEPAKAIGISAFHAISSFNNAGFDLLGSISLKAYSGNILLNINTAITIMLGGLGFIVINDIIEKRSLKRLSIHTKIVLKINLLLWTAGMLIFKFSEFNGEKFTWLESFFLSVTARTAGFTTINIASISSLTSMVLMILMFIGGSPASTAGGIKTTTFYTLTKGVTSFSRGKQVVTNNRLINEKSREKASLLLTTALILVIFASAGLIIFDKLSLENAFFEAISAFANVGLTKGITTTLSGGSKLLLTLLMFAGRVGPLTLLSLFNNRWYKGTFHNIEYIDERIMIG